MTASVQPVFLTDHPLAFQKQIFVDDGSNLDHFRDHVLWLTAHCASGVESRLGGDADTARRVLDQCVRQAPRFTRARIELAYTFMDQGRYDAARQQIDAVMQYAPDNTTAQYAAAYVQVQMGHPENAKPYFALLEQSGDHAMLEKMKSLQYYIDHKLPLKPGAPQ